MTISPQFRLTSTFMRPDNTTAYTDGDLVANHGTAGSVVPLEFVYPAGMGQGFTMQEWHFAKSGAVITNADFDLILFDMEPTPGVGDNAAFFAANVYQCTGGQDFVGVLEGGQMCEFDDDAANVYHKNIAATISHNMEGNASLWGFLYAKAAYTPAAEEVFTVTLSVRSHR